MFTFVCCISLVRATIFRDVTQAVTSFTEVLKVVQLAEVYNGRGSAFAMLHQVGVV